MGAPGLGRLAAAGQQAAAQQSAELRTIGARISSHPLQHNAGTLQGLISSCSFKQLGARC